MSRGPLEDRPRIDVLQIGPDDPASADAAPLIAALSATLRDLTGSDGRGSFDDDDVRQPRALFVVARDAAGTPVGCGAFRPLPREVTGRDDVMEVKRMFAVPGTRGVGSALLAHLERAGVKLGYRQAWLSSRALNPRAIEFYRRRGYATIANYGRYAGRAESVCLGKALV